MESQALPRLHVGTRPCHVLLLAPRQVRLLRVDQDRLWCVADGAGATPQGHEVARYLDDARERGNKDPLFVVLCPSEHRVVHEMLPGGRRLRPLMVRGKLDERFPDAAYRSSDVLPGLKFGAPLYRLSAVTEWPGLEAWLAWCCDRDLPLDGPYSAPLLLADAAFTGADAGWGHRILVARTHDAGAWLLSVQEKQIRLARYLGADLCGGAEPEARTVALAQQIERSCAWIAAQDQQSGQALSVDVLDVPEVLAALPARLRVPVRQSSLAAPAAPADAPGQAAGSLCDAAIVRALREAKRPTRLEAVQWRPRYQVARRSRQLLAATALALPLAAGAVGWLGWSALSAQAALERAQARLVEREKTAGDKRSLREQRDAEIARSAGGEPAEEFEKTARAYRQAFETAGTDAAMESLLLAVGQAIAQSGVTVQRISIVAGPGTRPPLLELAVDLPLGSPRPEGLRVLREVTTSLQQELKNHVVSVKGLDQVAAALPADAVPADARRPAEQSASSEGAVLIRVEPKA